MILLHLIPALGPGGAARSLATLVREARKTRRGIAHKVAILQDGGYPPLLFALKRDGAEVVRGASPERVAELMQLSDAMLIHFWNTPEIWRLLTSDLPACRTILWSKILGCDAPQLLNRRLLQSVTRLVTTAPLAGSAASVRTDATVIPGLADPTRLDGLVRREHTPFNVDYVGTTNRGKIHPNFIGMMSRLDIAGLKVRICGGPLEPPMQEELGASPSRKRFELCGFVEDIRSIFETSDVFAYPLAENSYATSDKSLQEAMLAGIVPVIFPHAGPARFVANGRNGIVASSEDEFVEAIQYLHRNPHERDRIGEEARRSAAEMFRPAEDARRLLDVISIAAAEPSALIFPGDGLPADAPAALLFLVSQDWDPDDAAVAIRDWSAGRVETLIDYAVRLDDDAFQIEGGLLHWRNHAPDDPLLRSWCALWLLRQGRPDEAVMEAERAVALGAPAESVANIRKHAA